MWFALRALVDGKIERVLANRLTIDDFHGVGYYDSIFVDFPSVLSEINPTQNNLL